MAHQDFKDSSTDCAICLASLGDGEVIELACGHIWHFDCVREQLVHAQPNHSQRLLFSGCRCAKCGTFCDHESLRNLTRRTDELMGKVDLLIREQLQIDAPQIWNEAQDLTKLVDEGKRTYAFYLCISCEEPYFGGTVECADQEGGHELPSEDRLCPTCLPLSQLVCQHPHEHGGFHIRKCRFCCEPSSFVCYGTVHFCESCHDRDSLRQRNQRQGMPGPPSLEPITCPGGRLCSFPKQRGQQSHLNGPSSACEQVYYCSMCLSSPGQTIVTDQVPGSRNLVLNPSGEQGLAHWHQIKPWVVETCDFPPSDAVGTNFVSSFYWCIMTQRVPIHQYVIDSASVRIEVSARFRCRCDCPSVFQLQGLLLDAAGRSLHLMQTPELQAPADFWEKASLIFDPIPGAHEIMIVVAGKDSRFWRGNYGTKVVECSVRVLGSLEELSEILLEA